MKMKNDYKYANTMLSNYPVAKSKQNIVVFKASQNTLSINDLGWSKYTDYITAYDVNGNHFSIIKDDTSKQIADIIQEDIDEKIKAFKSGQNIKKVNKK